MNTIVILFLIGLVFLAFEVVVPGAILGILGALSMVGGVVVAFVSFGPGGGMVAFGLALGLVALVLVVEFVLLPRTKFGRRMFLRTAIVGTSQPPVGDATLVGQEAEAVTPLAPSGLVLVGGRRLEAFSQSGHAARGDRLRVVGMDNFRIIVTKK